MASTTCCSPDVDNDDFRRLAQEPFDVVLMANTIDFLTNPREVFRSAWYLLKPGGQMLVAFSSKAATQGKYPDAVTKMWTDFNDDQHMWMTVRSKSENELPSRGSNLR